MRQTPSQTLRVVRGEKRGTSFQAEIDYFLNFSEGMEPHRVPRINNVMKSEPFLKVKHPHFPKGFEGQGQSGPVRALLQGGVSGPQRSEVTVTAGGRGGRARGPAPCSVLTARDVASYQADRDSRGPRGS